MSESKHTKNVLGVSSSFLVVSKAGQIIANCRPTGVEALDVSYEEACANAILYAAAPALLEACKAAKIMLLQSNWNGDDRMNIVSAAIAQAEKEGGA